MPASTTSAETRSVCCYCGVGCCIVIEHDAGRTVGMRGDPDHPANFGRLRTKGSTLHLTAVRETRALYPELRTTRDGARKRVAWDLPLDHAAARFARTIREHDPDSIVLLC